MSQHAGEDSTERLRRVETAMMQAAEHLYAHAIRQGSGRSPAEGRRRATRSGGVRRLRGLALPPSFPPSFHLSFSRRGGSVEGHAYVAAELAAFHLPPDAPPAPASNPHFSPFLLWLFWEATTDGSERRGGGAVRSQLIHPQGKRSDDKR